MSITIEQAKEILKNAGYLATDSLWHTDDIIHQAAEMGIELTVNEIEDIAYNIQKYFDASLGINWNTIEFQIQYTLDKRDNN